MTPITKPDDRSLTQLGATVHQDLANLQTRLADSELTPDGVAAFDQLRETVGSVTEHLGASGAGRAPVGGQVPAAPAGSVGEAAVQTAVDLATLAYRLDQEGLPVNPGLIDGMEMLGALHDELTHGRPDVAVAPPLAFQVPTSPLNTRPLDGVRPGERIDAMSTAARAFENQLRRDNAARRDALPPESPISRVANAFADEAAAARRRPQEYDAEAHREASRNQYNEVAEMQGYGSPKPHPETEPTIYRHGDRHKTYQGRPRSSTTDWSFNGKQ